MKCSNCQFENPEGMNFCGQCGTSLQSAQPRHRFHPEHPETSLISEAERKPVTALSKDLSGYTSTIAQLDPDLDKTSSPESVQESEATAGRPVCTIHGSPCLLDMVLRTSTCLTKTMDLDHFLEVATTELTEFMEVDAAGVLLYDDRLADLYVREVRDPKHVLVGNGSDGGLRIDRTALDTAFQTGEPVVTGDDDGTSTLRASFENDAGASIIRNALVVPLNTREKTIGLLVLVNKKTGRFKETDIGVMISMAGVLALSVENADFFDELIDSYKKAVGFERIKSKILHRLSHELKTPLTVIKASLRHVETGLKERGIQDFARAFDRLSRQVENLRRLEMQVDSIMKRGYAEEREMITGVLESAAALIEVQAEEKPEMVRVASLLLKTLEDAFPANREQRERIDVGEFGRSVLEHARGEMSRQGRRVHLTVELDTGSEVLIPDLVLHATIEGLVRNAVEATPDNGMVAVRGRSNGNFYSVTVEDSGIGIPEEDWGLVFEGFYQVQETDDYTSGRPYAFNAGGKGMDLFRIKMFSKIYGFGLYFKTRRCRHLVEELRQCPGCVERCQYCTSLKDCMESGGTVFEIELPQ